MDGHDDSVLNRIAVLNRDLLAAAREGNWQRVRSLEEARRNLVRGVFEGGPGRVDPRLFGCIREIVRVDREIVRLSLARRRREPPLSACLRSSAR